MPRSNFPEPGLGEPFLLEPAGNDEISVASDDDSLAEDNSDSSWFSWLCSSSAGRSFFCSRRFCALSLVALGIGGIAAGVAVASSDDSKERSMTGEITLKLPEGADKYSAGVWCSVQASVKVDRAGSDLAPVLALSNPDTSALQEFGEFPATGAYWQKGDKRFLVTSPDAMGSLTESFYPGIAKYSHPYETGPLDQLVRVPPGINKFDFNFSLLTGVPGSKGGVIVTLYSPSLNSNYGGDDDNYASNGHYSWRKVASQRLTVNWGAFPKPRIVKEGTPEDDWRNITAGEPAALFPGKVDIDVLPPLNAMPSLTDFDDGRIGKWSLMIALQRMFSDKFTKTDALTVSLSDHGQPFKVCEFFNDTDSCSVERDFHDTGSLLKVMRALAVNVSAPDNSVRVNVTGVMKPIGFVYDHPSEVPTDTVSTLFFARGNTTTMSKVGEIKAEDDHHSDVRLLA